MVRTPQITTHTAMSWLAWVVGIMATTACTKPNPDLVVIADSLAEASEDAEAEGDDSGDSLDSETGDGDESVDSGSGSLELVDMPDHGSCETPESLFAPSCASCLAQACCDQLLACIEDEGCECLSDCMLRGGGELSCKVQCLLEDTPELPSTVAELEQCGEDSCADSCSDSQG